MGKKKQSQSHVTTTKIVEQNCQKETVYKMDASFRDWAGLPIHIVDLIVTMLDGFSDYLRFCGVCPQWRYAALDANLDSNVKLKVLKASQRKLPMLMFMTDENNERRSLFSISDGITYDINFPLPYKSRFVGSSCGWLFCLDRTMVLTLVNPCNNSCISLPVFKDPNHLFREWRKKFFDYYIKKGILFSDTSVSSKGFGVVVIYGGLLELALFKYGETSWNFINSGENRYHAADIICYKGTLYAVDCNSRLVEIDIANKTIKTIVPTNDRYFDQPDIAYLVESQDGELLMVKRFWLRGGDDNNNGHDEDRPVGEGVSEDDEVYDEDDNDDDELDNLASLEISSSDTDGESSDRDFDDYPRSFEFEVFKMTQPIGEGLACWEKINNIGKQALFVGDNHSVSVSTVEFPKCLPNSIYFTSQHHHGLFPYVYLGVNEDSFIYTLEDKRFFYHHMLDKSLKYTQPPIWFVPNPQQINLG